MTAIKIQFTLFSAFYSPIIATMSGGFLKQQGLDYEWSVSPPGRSAVDAIIDGSAHVAQSAPSHGFNTPQRTEAPFPVHFAQVNEMDGFFISARDADPDFSWDKLEGAEVVMFKAGQPNAMFRYACHKAGIDYDKIIAITPGGPDDIDEAFRAGQGQYVQQQGPYPQQLEAEGLGNIVAQVGPQKRYGQSLHPGLCECAPLPEPGLGQRNCSGRAIIFSQHRCNSIRELYRKLSGPGLLDSARGNNARRF